jgi:CheY-like chemotaxis protein
MTKVLIIEDEPMHADLAAAALRRAGYSVLCAPDGETGIRLANESLPDLILMDLHLPDMDGIRVAHILKEEDRTQDIRILAYSVDDGNGSYRAFFRRIFAGIVRKPFSVNILLDTVRSALSAPALVPGTAL